MVSACGLARPEQASTTDARDGADADDRRLILASSQMHDMGAGWWVLMVLDGGREVPSAREVLDRRLAEGDITVEEHERLRDALRRPAGSTRSHS